MGHTGAAEYWIPMPRASAHNVNVGNVSRKLHLLIPVSCMNDSRYSKVNRWRIDYGESIILTKIFLSIQTILIQHSDE